MPQAAAENFAGGDVRHVSSIVDALSGDAIAQGTRHLAYRDTLLASKVNEIIAAINNKDQFINLPTVTTTLPAGAIQVVTNFRIPPGFEARVLNAAVSSTPVSSFKLSIGYNANQFGLTTYDTETVSTFNEFTAGTPFYGTGELVVQLTNVNSRTATGTASIALTMRPVAAQKGGIIGPGAVGPKGSKGDKGDQGDQGNPGSPGPAGPIGATWRGPWNSGSNFAARDLTEWFGSTWFAKTPNINVAPPTDPTVGSATWDLVSKAGAQGAQGSQGSQGGQGSQGFQGNSGPQGNQGNMGTSGQGFNVTGSYNSGATYNAYDVVNYDIGQDRYTFFASSFVGTNVPPPNSPWAGLFGPFVGAGYAGRIAVTATETGVDYVAGSANGLYVAIPSGSNYNQFQWSESSVFGGPPGFGFTGLSTLRGTKRAVFRGQLTVDLPLQADGLKRGWTTSDVEVQVTGQGTIPVAGATVEVVSLNGSNFTVINNSTIASKVQITVTGHKSWPE